MDRRLEKPAIFLHVGSRIPFREREIEDLLAVQQADASMGSAEAVHQPREITKRGNLKHRNPAR